MKYVFGPVPSRRLGRSLGVDTVPLKTCNWNCVHCQLGRSCPVTNQRRQYFPTDQILDEVRCAVEAQRPGAIDWVSLVASGEGTLFSQIGVVIRQVKASTNLPVAVITNGSLLYLPNVRESLCAADAVLPSLNAGSETLHRQINRPHHDMTFERHMKGLIAFRREYHGNLWVEVMLVAGVNDTEEALWDIAAALDKIDPDEVHLMLPTRPPAERWVRPPDAARLRRAQTILGSTSRLVPAFEEPCAPRNGEDLMGAALGSISRHPMNLRQLEAALSPWTPTQVREALDQLEARGKIQRVWRFDELFWCPAPSSYGETKAASAKT